MKIIAWPAFKNKDENSYNWQLYTELKNYPEIEIDEFKLTNAFKKGYNLFHLHWPDSILNYPSTILVLTKVVAFFSALFILKIKGARVLWTAHNYKSHENYHPFIEKIFWWLFLRNIDAYISLTKSGINVLEKRYPILKRKPHFVIPHGDYTKDNNIITRKEARQNLNLTTKQTMLLHFGRIRNYKGAIELINNFNKINDENLILYIVGKADDLDILHKLNALSNKRVVIVPRLLSEKEINIYFKAADLIIIPYKAILNSGVTFLSLSFNRPILLPRTAIFEEIKAKTGEEFIHLYERLTPSQIKSTISKIKNKKNLSKPNLDWCSWKKISLATNIAYNEMLKKK